MTSRDDGGTRRRRNGVAATTGATTTGRATAAGAAGAGAIVTARTAAANRRESREAREEFTGELLTLEGLLDLRDEGYGFLRTSGYLAGRNDAYVSASQVRRFGLRKGDYVKGAIRPPASSEKYPALVRVDFINGMTPDEARSATAFRGPHAAVPGLEVAPRARRRAR